MALSFADRMAALKKAAPVISPVVEVAVEKEQAAVVPPKKVFGKPSANPLPVETIEVVEKVVEQESIGNIILLANEAHKIIPNSSRELTEGEHLVEGDMPVDAIRIKQKIAEMETFDGISLRHEMDQLKKLIKASPDACMFLLPEELGLCVRALRRMTDNKVAMDMGTIKARASKKQVEIKLTAEDIAAALDDL